jgi:hypothetical protein
MTSQEIKKLHRSFFGDGVNRWIVQPVQRKDKPQKAETT